MRRRRRERLLAALRRERGGSRYRLTRAQCGRLLKALARLPDAGPARGEF